MSRQKERDRISKVLSALEGVFIETAFEANPEELLINHLIDNNTGGEMKHFSVTRKCKRCKFEICISSADDNATAGDWKYCPKCGHNNKTDTIDYNKTTDDK